MKLEDSRENYYFFSQKTSDVVRQLGFAAIGIIWFFKNSSEGRYIIPSELLLPAILVVTGLGCDLLQYLSGTVAWGIYSRLKERSGIKDGKEFDDPPPQINWGTIFFFWLKIISILIAYVMIFSFLIRAIS